MDESEHNPPEENAPDLQESEISPLREEIRNSEAARLDFLKYKLIAIATLAAVAFGMGEWDKHPEGIEPRYVLALIPFVCIYVDALCYHNNLRILVIAKYMRCNGDAYEIFLSQWDQLLNNKYKEGIGDYFKIEDWIIDYSTRVFAALVIVAGMTISVSLAVQGACISLAGLLGLTLSFYIRNQFDRKVQSIFRDSCSEIKTRYPSGT